MSSIDETGQPRAKSCVVVSYWTGRPANRLHKLLDQMRVVDAGSPFDLTIVANGGDKSPMTLPARFDSLKPRILNRANLGYNIGAWDHGWRTSEPRENYLFIQDDCTIKEAGWVSEFEFRVEADQGIGLLGEMINYDRMTWDYVRAVHYQSYTGDPSRWPEPVHPIDFYRDRFERQGVPWSEIAAHLPSIILFSPRRVLEEIGGFPFFGPSYREAITSEFAISRLVESKGYRISKVTDYPFELIGHPQWSSTGKIRLEGFPGFVADWISPARAALKRTLGLKRKSRRARPAVPAKVSG